MLMESILSMSSEVDWITKSDFSTYFILGSTVGFEMCENLDYGLIALLISKCLDSSSDYESSPVLNNNLDFSKSPTPEFCYIL